MASDTGMAISDAGDGENRDFPQHEFQQAGASGAECQADADFARAARHGVGHDAVEPDGGEQGGQNAEEGGESGHDALRGERLVDLIFHGAQAGDGECRNRAR